MSPWDFPSNRKGMFPNVKTNKAPLENKWVRLKEKVGRSVLVRFWGEYYTDWEIARSHLSSTNWLCPCDVPYSPEFFATLLWAQCPEQQWFEIQFKGKSYLMYSIQRCRTPIKLNQTKLNQLKVKNNLMHSAEWWRTPIKRYIGLCWQGNQHAMCNGQK